MGTQLRTHGMRLGMALCLGLLACGQNPVAPASAGACRQLTFSGAVNAGQEWDAAIGEGWVFRVMPIQDAAYSGWDLVVDRDRPAGYPDALLLATPPYNSINEREIANTFGLRAQDALGWNPRSFHFLVDAAALRQGRQLFAELNRAAQPASGHGSAPNVAELTRALMALNAHAAAGEFRILDARITPGTADAAPFAGNWAMAGERMQHSDEPAAAGQSSAQGEFHWIRFSVTFWLPPDWTPAKGVPSRPAPCEK